MVILEVPTHLSSKPPTTYSIRVSEEHFFLYKNLTRSTYCEISCLHWYPHRLKIAKTAISLCFSGFSSESKSVFYETTGCIASIKVSLDSSIFLEGDLKIYLGFCILLQSLDKLITATNAEGSGGNDICGKPLRTRLKKLSSLS